MYSREGKLFFSPRATFLSGQLSEGHMAVVVRACWQAAKYKSLGDKSTPGFAFMILKVSSVWFPAQKKHGGFWRLA